MSRIIQSTADSARIEDHFRRTVTKALAHGGAVAAAAQERLLPALADLDAVVAERKPALEAEAAARAAVEIQEEICRVHVCAKRDDFWTLVGRSQHNRYMAQVFPLGVDTYTTGDARNKPVLMLVLNRRLERCSAVQLTDELRKTWISELEIDRQGLVDVLAKHALTAGPAAVVEAAYITAARMAREQMRLFKRDLENLGMSKPQIFDIIPDATPTQKPQKTPTPVPTPKAA